MIRKKKTFVKITSILIIAAVAFGGGYAALNTYNDAFAAFRHGRKTTQPAERGKNKTKNDWWSQQATMRPDIIQDGTVEETASSKVTVAPTATAAPAVAKSNTVAVATQSSSEETTSEKVSKSAESSLITAPLTQFDKTTPTKGNIKALVVEIEFSDVKYASGALSADELEKAVFANEDIDSAFYPMESVKAYYERASYGNLTIDGDVVSYTAKNTRNYYKNKNEYETLVMEALSALDSQINYADYDTNKDGYLDCFSVNVPTNGTSDDDFWYGCQATWYNNPSYKVDGTKIKGYVMNDEQPIADRINQYNATLSHEIGHLMGLPDYYKYNSSNWQGLKGSAGYERMDDSMGDFSTFSKIMLGWVKSSDIKVANLSSSSETYKISSSSKDNAECVIVPVGKLNDNYFSEYFLIEYVTADNNNNRVYSDGGIRVLHVNATAMTSLYNNNYKMFKYENYSNYYDTSDNGIRILKLVNDNNGFYKAGSTVKYGASNFATYDTNGNATINPEFSISVGELSNGEYSISITK